MRARTWVAATVAIAGILALAGGAAGSNDSSWPDPAGDSGTAADLTQIALRNDDAGTLTFDLAYGNRSGLAEGDRIHIFLDTDDDGSTGMDGSDYGIALIKDDALLVRWADGEWVNAPDTTFSASPDGRTVTVNRSELGNPTRLLFWVRSDLLSESGDSVDDAPDAADRLFLHWVVGPAPTRLITAFAPPKAGTVFTVLMPIVQLENGGTSSAFFMDVVACKGTLGGKPLNGRAGQGKCTWRLPKTAKGKRFTFTITLSNNGAAATFKWRRTVR